MFQLKCDKCKRVINNRGKDGQLEIRGVASLPSIDLCASCARPIEQMVRRHVGARRHETQS
jgi:hypothetical protein